MEMDMQMEVEEDDVEIVIWKILNFNCWNETVHESLIETPCVIRSGCEFFNLYPKGQNNDEEHLQIILMNVVYDFAYEVFFYGPDGFLLHRLEGSSKRRESYDVKLPPGPKFEDVVAHIKSKETLFKDSLCIEFRLKGIDRAHRQYRPFPELRVCTTIEVAEIRSDVELKFVARDCKIDPLILYSDCDKDVSFKNVSENDDEVDVELTLKSYRSEVFCVKSAFYLNNTRVLVNKEIVLSNEAPQTVASLQGVKDLMKNARVLFNFKIICGNIFTSYECVFRQRPIKYQIDSLNETFIPLLCAATTNVSEVSESGDKRKEIRLRSAA